MNWMRTMCLCLCLAQIWVIGSEDKKYRQTISLIFATAAWIMCMFAVPWE